MRPENPSLDQKYFSALDSKQKLVHLIKFAALAPSSHNTQPWLFKVGTDEIEVSYDPKRLLAVSDPSGRQMYLSLGAAVENIVTAAKYFGLEAIFENQPSGQKAGRIKIKAGSSAEPDASALELAKAIFSRHNNRAEYEERQPAAEFVSWLKDQNGEFEITLVVDQAKKVEVANLVGDALKDAVDDQKFREELSQWIKPSLSKYTDGMPGYNLGMPAAVSFVFPRLLRKFKMGSTQRKMEMRNLLHTPMFVILSALRDQPAVWLNAGRLFEKIALQAETAGLRIGVLAAAIEVPRYSDKLRAALNISGRPLMFFRLGYCTKVPKASPRLDVSRLIMETND